MLLAVDIGNTNITFGIFDGKKLVEVLRCVSDKSLCFGEYEKFLSQINYSIDTCIIASVVEELTYELKRACDKTFGLTSLILSCKSRLNVYLDVEVPEKIGADRIANVCAGAAMYSKPFIVIDLGTATTFDIVSKDGGFFGGIIMPGLSLQLKSLSQNTSKLPQIEVQESEKAIGVDTKSAILSGVIRGAACAIEGLISQCEQEMGEKVTTIATGGYSTLISKYMTRKFDYVDPNLTLQGLRYIYEMNRSNSLQFEIEAIK